jgi:hypothetical protein
LVHNGQDVLVEDAFLVVPKIVFIVPSIPISRTGRRQDDSNFYFLITSTHDIYYDVRKPYKDAYI